MPNNKSWSEDFRVGIRDLINVIGDGSNLSSYEIQSTNLIKLLGCILEEVVLLAMPFVHAVALYVGYFSGSCRGPFAGCACWNLEGSFSSSGNRCAVRLLSGVEKNFYEYSIFSPGKSPADTLVQTIVSVLECTEKLPVQAFDVSAPGSGFLVRSIDLIFFLYTFSIRFQALTRPITTKLEIRGSTAKFVDRTGRKLRIEPLVTIREVENYLWKKVIFAFVLLELLCQTHSLVCADYDFMVGI